MKKPLLQLAKKGPYKTAEVHEPGTPNPELIISSELHQEQVTVEVHEPGTEIIPSTILQELQILLVLTHATTCTGYHFSKHSG